MGVFTPLGQRGEVECHSSVRLQISRYSVVKYYTLMIIKQRMN